MLLASPEVVFTQVNISTPSDLFYSKLYHFLSHLSRKNAGGIQESLTNISANLCSPVEKYSSGVEDEGQKFSGKCRSFQREIRISTTKYFHVALFLCEGIREGSAVVPWEISAVPPSCDTTNVPRDKAGCLLLVVDPALFRGTQCPIHGCGVKLSTDLAGCGTKKTCFHLKHSSDFKTITPVGQLSLVHREKAGGAGLGSGVGAGLEGSWRSLPTAAIPWAAPHLCISFLPSLQEWVASLLFIYILRDSASLIVYYSPQELPYKFLGRLDDPAFNATGVTLMYTPATNTTRKIMAKVATSSALRGKCS